MTTRYITNGFDLTDKEGYRFRVDPTGQTLVLDEDVYLKDGTPTASGSIRFSIDDETGWTQVQKLINGVWQPASFETGPNSLWLGKTVGVAGLGHHLATESSDGHLHFHCHSEYDGELTMDDASVVYADFYTDYMLVQPDQSGEYTGKSFEYGHLTTSHALLETFYIRTGNTPAGDTMRFQVWENTTPSGLITFDQRYPASQFPANTEVPLHLAGKMEYLYNTNYYFRLSSDEDFSLKTNASGTQWTLAIAFSRVREDSLLQTKKYVDGDTFDNGQYLIDSRKIYVCNTTATQSGTFASNSDKWSGMASEDYVDTAVSVEDLWDRTGTVLSPKNPGDSLAVDGISVLADLTIDGHQLKRVSGNMEVVAEDGTLFLEAYGSYGVILDAYDGQISLSSDTLLSSDIDLIFRGTTSSVQGIIFQNNAQDVKGYINYTDAGPGAGQIDIHAEGALGISSNDSITISGSSVDIDGDLDVNGTIDGVLKDGVTATTQSVLDNSTKVATTAYVDSAVTVEDLWDLTTGTLQNKSGPTELVFNDVTRDRFEVGPAISRLFSPNGSWNLYVNDAAVAMFDGTNHRIYCTDQFSQLNSPNAQKKLIINNTNSTFTGDLVVIGNTTINDGTNNRFEVGSLNTALYSPDRSLKVGATDSLAYLADSSRNRIYVDTNGTELISPDGTETFKVDDTGLVTSSTVLYTPTEFLIYDGTRSRLLATTAVTSIVSPNGTYKVEADNTGVILKASSTTNLVVMPATMYFNDATRDRIRADSTETKAVSPDGASILAINNTQTEVTGALDISGQLTVGSDFGALVLAPTSLDYGGGQMLIKGGPAGPYPDWVVDHFWGALRIYLSSAVTTRIAMENIGAGGVQLGVGLSNTNIWANLDVDGSGTSGIGLQLRSGCVSTENPASQIVMAYDGNAYGQDGYAHSIKTKHNVNAKAGNSIDFYVWDYDTDASTAIGTQKVLSLDSTAVVITNAFTQSGGAVKMTSLPTSDPVDAGALWNDGGTLKVSSG